MKYILYVFALLLIFNSSCEKDNFSPPEIEITALTILSPTEIRVSGKVKNVGAQNSKEYGVVYSDYPFNIKENSKKISLGNEVKKGEFTKDLKNIYIDNAGLGGEIFITAYISDDKGIVYGNTKSVKLPKATTSNIVPSFGKSNDVVKIIGNFYQPTLENVLVQFHSVSAKVLSVNNSEITVEVPAGIPASHNSAININVRVGNVEAYRNSSFTILANIKDFTPKTGVIGAKINFIGDNIPTYFYYDNKIQLYLDDKILENSNISDFRIPFLAKENSKLSFMTNGKLVDIGTFNLLLPQIETLSPVELWPNEVFYVSGRNFPLVSSDYYGNNKVKIGNLDYQNIYNHSSDKLSYAIPSNLKEGEYPLYVLFGSHNTQSPINLKVKGIKANSFTPTSGLPGSKLTISGEFKENNAYHVFYGDKEMYAYASSKTQLTVSVPSDHINNKVKIKVVGFGKEVILPGEFEILGPKLSTFAPLSAVAGTVLTLKGENFIVNNTQVLFGNIEVNPLEVSANTIKVIVPSNILPGAMKLSIRSYGQLSTYSDNFTLTN